MKKNKTVNVNSGSKDKVERDLDNCSAHEFWMRLELFPSVDAFIRSIKFRRNDPMRDLIKKATPSEAKELEKNAKADFVYWNEKEIVHGSKEHHELIEKAMRSKFRNNPDAMESLLSTVGKKITCNVGPENSPTSLPKDLFCRILTKIREENMITIDKLVVLKYANNECYVEAVSVKEAKKQYNGYFEINLAKRTWKYGSRVFRISERRECERGSRGGVIGVYNRFSLDDLDSMVNAATNAVETDHIFNCD